MQSMVASFVLTEVVRRKDGISKNGGKEMADKIMTAQEAIADIKDGAVIMVGGFMACGTPEILIDALVEKNVKNLTIICNDAGVPGRGVGKLLTNGQIKTLIAPM